MKARRLAMAIVLLCGLAQAAVLSPTKHSFLGGELSPLIQYRPDIQQYQSGAQELENILVIGPGAAARRPGTFYVAGTQNNDAARLMPFIYSEADAYVLEFTPGKIRFYREDGQILDGGSAYEIATSYTADELFELQVYQSYDVMYIVHGDHWPQKLTRSGHASWTIADADITDGPFLDENTTTTTISASAVTGSVTLTASASIFDDPDHVGALWKLDQLLESQQVTDTFSATGTSSSVVAGQGASYEFTLDDAACKCSIALQYSKDDGVTWESHYVVTNSTVLAMAVDFNDVSDWDQNVLLRMNCTSFTSGTIDYDLQVGSYTHSGFCEITAVASGTEATATVHDRLGEASATTRYWSEGAWSDDEGHPTCITGCGGRVVYGKDMDLYWSKTDDYENFYEGIDADQSFSYSLGQGRSSPLRWLFAEKSTSLVAGTLSRIYEIAPFDALSSFYPTNLPRIASAANVACAERQPIRAGSSLLFTDRTGKRVHEMMYDYDQDTVTGPDLTILADHITGTGLQQIEFQKSPYPTLWGIRNDGEMATMYYNRPFQVAAWSRQVTDGNFTSVAVVPIEDGDDRVWVVVERTIGGASKYYVEYFDDLDIDGALADAYYLDSGLTFDGGDAVVITGITAADPGVVTVSSWPTDLEDGDNVIIESVSGMTEINGRYFIVDDATEGSLTFSLDSVGNADWDTSGYTAYSSGGTAQIVENTFANLDHLEGEAIAMFADSAEWDDQIVASGSVTMDEYVNQAAGGLGYTSTIQPVPLEYSGKAGSVRPYAKRLIELYVDFYCSAGAKYGLGTSSLSAFQWPRDTDDEVRDLHTGSLTVPAFGGAVRDLDFLLTSEGPYPFVIRSIVPVFEVQ